MPGTDSTAHVEAQLEQTISFLNRLDASVSKIADAAQSLSIASAVQNQKVEELQKSVQELASAQTRQAEASAVTFENQKHLDELKKELAHVRAQMSQMNKIRWLVTGAFLGVAMVYDYLHHGLSAAVHALFGI